MMSRALAAALIMFAPVAGADWLQAGGDSQGTRRAAGTPPEWPDVAFEIGIEPTEFSLVSPPLLVNGSMYVVSERQVSNGINPILLVRLDIRTGIAHVVADFEVRTLPDSWRESQLASDGAFIYIFAEARVFTFEIASGALSGPLALMPSAGEAASYTEYDVCCTGAKDVMVHADGRLFIATSTNFGPHRELRLFVVDPSNGTVEGPIVERPRPPSLDDPLNFPVPDHGSHLLRVDGLAVQDRVAVVTASFVPSYDLSGLPPARQLWHTWTVDTSTGEEWGTSRWTITTTGWTSPPLIIGDRVFTNVGRMRASNLSTGDDTAEYVPVPADADADAVSSLASDGSRVFLAAGERIYAFGADLQLLWAEPVTLGSDRPQPRGLIATNEMLLVLARSIERGPSTLYVLDARSGAALWRHPLPAEAVFAADDGLIVTFDTRWVATVIGKTPLSLVPTLATSSTYPAPGEEVTIDLSGTRASPLGAPTAYRVDWGDGSVSDWSPDPLMRHVYATAFESQARAFVRNDVGQVASAPITFHVGQRDPAVNILNSPLSDAYQNTTFFILGLIGTAIVGLVGIARAGRKRRRLDRELRELESDYKRLEADVPACDRMLSERRARARALFLERKLEEAHSSFLVARIDELRRGLRLSTVDDRLKFLPYGMVLHLQKLLADGRVDAFEREHFLVALRADATLSPDQKQHTERLIDSWFARDGAA